MSDVWTVEAAVNALKQRERDVYELAGDWRQMAEDPQASGERCAVLRHLAGELESLARSWRKAET